MTQIRRGEYYDGGGGPGNRIKGKGNGAGLAWESQTDCFADDFNIAHANSLGTDPQHDYVSQGNCRKTSSSLFYYILLYSTIFYYVLLYSTMFY